MEASRIFIVEDEGIVALDIQNTLTQLGFQVCGIANTGEEAIRSALECQPDLILMDIRLTGEMDGIEAAEHIRAVLDIPIVFLTAYADQPTLERAKLIQPYGYISKPLNIKDLQITIEISLYRHTMEKRERQNAHRYEQVFNTVAHGLILLDENHTIQIANQQAQDYLRILAPSHEFDPGERLDQLDNRAIEEFLTAGTRESPTLAHEITVDAPPKRIFALNVVPMTSAPGTTADSPGWVLTIQDITEARQHEHAQNQQQRLAAVGQLAAGIAHDFGNILATISIAAEIIPKIEENLKSNSKEHLKRIGNQVQRATDLVTQILDFSRKSSLERTTVDLVPLYKEWLKLLDHALPEGIQLHLSYPEYPCLVDVDPTRMQQVLWNLVLNARDSLASDGTIAIALDTVAFDTERQPRLQDLEGKEWVRVQVSDNGTGIDPEVLPHIFEPFFTTKQPGHGTGLGLAQVYGIVQQHDGMIDVSSAVGEGTMFTVFLPLAKR